MTNNRCRGREETKGTKCIERKRPRRRDGGFTTEQEGTEGKT
jgi:hypothetical protein